MTDNVFVAASAVLRTDPNQATWWAEYIPWFALGIFVVSVVLSVVFLPFVLRGGMSRFAVTKAMIADNGDPQASRPVVASAASQTAPDGTAADTEKGHVSSSPTWENMDLSIFDGD